MRGPLVMCCRLTMPCRNSSITTTAIFGTGPLRPVSAACERNWQSSLVCSESGYTNSRTPYFLAMERSSTASDSCMGDPQGMVAGCRVIELSSCRGAVGLDNQTTRQLDNSSYHPHIAIENTLVPM